MRGKACRLASSLVVGILVSLMLATSTAQARLGQPETGAGTTLLGFYSWDPTIFLGIAGKQHAVRWRTVDWNPSKNFGETWAATITAAASGGWALQVTWSSERYDYATGDPVAAISSDAIARGRGDAQIIAAVRGLSASPVPVILRFDPEMNGYWHSYCARNRGGSARGPEDSAASFVAAWRRVRTIFRGGGRARVNAALIRLGQPRLTVPSVGRIGAPKVRFAWVPNVSANPVTRGNTNTASAYYPGDAYVDWAGVDLYDDKPQNTDWAALRGFLNAQYVAHPAKPFGLFEWGLRSRTDDGIFVDDVFGWLANHRRVALIEWYDSAHSRLADNPLAAAAYRRGIQSPRYTGSRSDFPR